MTTKLPTHLSKEPIDIMIPGGGVGKYNGCSSQWGVSANDLGAQYGGFLTTCQKQNGYDDLNKLKTCVRNKCNSVFGSKPALKQLQDGCLWFVDWMNVADNPTFKKQEIACPAELKQAYSK